MFNIIYFNGNFINHNKTFHFSLDIGYEEMCNKYQLLQKKLLQFEWTSTVPLEICKKSTPETSIWKMISKILHKFRLEQGKS